MNGSWRRNCTGQLGWELDEAAGEEGGDTAGVGVGKETGEEAG